jgi:hypothetical protein
VEKDRTGRHQFRRSGLRAIILILAASLVSLPLLAREKDTASYGEGLIVNLPFPESEVTQVVQDVVQDGLIRGTKEYNKDEYVSGADPATSSRAFKDWTEGGKVFYKVRLKALDPRNFKDSNDVGTLTVRYIVQPQGDKNTVLRINALYVEEFRHTVHQSNGSVESAEYKDIHDRLDAIETMKAQTVEAEKEKQEQLTKRSHAPSATAPLVDESSSSVSHPAPVQAATVAPEPAPSSAVANPAPPQPDLPRNDASISTPPSAVPQTLEQRVQDLRRQVERLVKAPGAPLKSAPFHTASTLQSLPAGTEILIVVTTPYWLGVETHDGQHGWMLRDQLELLP